MFLANSSGRVFFLPRVSSRAFRRPDLAPRTAALLERNDFFSDRLDLDGVGSRLRGRYFADYAGPYIHIVTLTNRCSLNCAYCSASANSSPGRDMTRATADRLLAFVFSIRSGGLTLEFQGGEPLLNFGVLRYIVEEAKRLNRKAGKRLHFSVVTNLQNMDSEKLDFLERSGVSVCASFDAVRRVHDANRASGAGSNYDRVVRWLGEIGRRRASGSSMEAPNAICTVTRALLPYPEETVDSYVENGLYRIQLGPLDPLGRAAGNSGLGYTPEEYFAFYRRALQRMGELTMREGRAVYEKGAFNILKMTETAERNPHRNLELLVRLAYDRNGDIYPSDEARMLASSGDDFFRLGNVRRDTFEGILGTPLARTLIASCFGELSQPYCARCPYSYYCRISPVYNYVFQGSFWGDLASSDRCRFFKLMFGLVLKLKRDRRWKKIFDIWLAEGVD
jgi:sulfatase maturation enzyme AslB (radical SAM superfamily)